MKSFKKLKNWDYLGITASLVCAVHCSVLPIAIGMGLLGSSLLHSHGLFEGVFIVLSLIFAFSSLYRSYRFVHRNHWPFLLFVMGLLLVITGLYFHGNAEIILATAGGLIIAASHMVNIRFSHRKGYLCRI